MAVAACISLFKGGEGYVDYPDVKLQRIIGMSQPHAQSTGPTPGRLISDRYEVVDQIGSGKMGRVFHVLDRLLDGRSLCLKLIHPQLLTDAGVVAKLRSEAALVRQLVHPSIARVWDLDADNDLFYLTLEYVEGCNLGELRRSYAAGALPLSEATLIVTRVAEGLGEAHRRGISHGDLKPENVLIGTHSVVKVTDFRLAGAFESSMGLTRTGETVSAPLYMAPEKFDQNAASAAGDVYSLGVMAYELIAGKAPYSGRDYFSLAKQHKEQPIDLTVLLEKGAPAGLCELLGRCLTKDPHRRPPDCAEVAEELKSFQQETDGLSLQCETNINEIVRSREGYWPKRVRIIGRVCSVGLLLILFAGTVIQQDAQNRILQALFTVERQLGWGSPKLVHALGGISVSANDPMALIAVVKRGHYDLAADLALAGCDANAVDEDGNGLWHHAVTRSVSRFYAEMVEVSALPNPDLVNKRGETALFWAALHGDISAINILRHVGADPGIPDQRGRRALEIAVKKRGVLAVAALGSFPAEKLQLNKLDGNGWPLIINAVNTGDPEMVEVTAHIGADINARDVDGRTALMAVSMLPDRLAEDLARLLLGLGADLGARDDQGLTAIDHAARRNQTGVLRILERHASGK